MGLVQTSVPIDRERGCGRRDGLAAALSKGDSGTAPCRIEERQVAVFAKVKDARGLFVGSVVLQTLIFGLGSAITKIAYDSVTPLWCMALRFGIAFLVFMIPFGGLILRELRAARLRDWLPAAGGMAVSYIGANIALDLTTATNVGFLVALPVVFAPFIAIPVLHRRYRLYHLPFQIAVVAGLFLLCSNGGSFAFGAGEALALLGSVGIACALVFGEKGQPQRGHRVRHAGGRDLRRIPRRRARLRAAAGCGRRDSRGVGGHRVFGAGQHVPHVLAAEHRPDPSGILHGVDATHRRTHLHGAVQLDDPGRDALADRLGGIRHHHRVLGGRDLSRRPQGRVAFG